MKSYWTSIDFDFRNAFDACFFLFIHTPEPFPEQPRKLIKISRTAGELRTFRNENGGSKKFQFHPNFRRAPFQKLHVTFQSLLLPRYRTISRKTLRHGGTGGAQIKKKYISDNPVRKRCQWKILKVNFYGEKSPTIETFRSSVVSARVTRLIDLYEKIATEWRGCAAPRCL